MPMDINLECLDDGCGLEDAMKRCHTSWHRSCPLKFNQTLVECLVRRNIIKEEKEFVKGDKRWRVHKKGRKIVLVC